MFSDFVVLWLVDLGLGLMLVWFAFYGLLIWNLSVCVRCDFWVWDFVFGCDFCVDFGDFGVNLRFFVCWRVGIIQEIW